jgi:hypothetical protein
MTDEPSDFRWRGKPTSELSINELREAVRFFAEGHDRYIRYQESEDMKKLKIENDLMKEILGICK